MGTNKRRIIELTEGEARAAAGHLCWLQRYHGPLRYGLACSRERGHLTDYGAGGCRFDMRIKVPTWTPDRVRLAIGAAALSFLVAAVVSASLLVAR